MFKRNLDAGTIGLHWSFTRVSQRLPGGRRVHPAGIAVHQRVIEFRQEVLEATREPIKVFVNSRKTTEERQDHQGILQLTVSTAELCMYCTVVVALYADLASTVGTKQYKYVHLHIYVYIDLSIYIYIDLYIYTYMYLYI